MTRPIRQRILLFFPILSALLCAALAACYILRPDSFAAVTIFPVWAWTPMGLLLVLPGLRIKPRRVLAVAVTLWVIYTLGLSEEPSSLLSRPRMSSAQFESARNSGRALRVVTLNCSGGSLQAALEVKRYDPDIVLLQESPSRAHVERLAREIFGEEGGFAWNVDASVAARGRVKARKLPTDLSSLSTFAHVKTASGIELDAISLRLVPPVFRLDLWSPGCWRDQANNRRHRRGELRQIAEELDRLPNDAPVVLGGDFNAPAGDAVYPALAPGLRDSFRARGVGWGNTALNDFPIQRIDQVWTSRHFQVVGVTAHKTRNSDHRLVVCDLVLN